jgi:hypothetical protein
MVWRRVIDKRADIMDKSGAEKLCERIRSEPFGGWRAKATYDSRAGEWAVQAWQAADGAATATTYTSAYGWHFAKAKMASVTRQLKRMRLLNAARLTWYR